MAVVEQFREKIQRRKELWWVLILVYTVFSGCFSFPLRMPGDMFGWSTVFIPVFSWLLLGVLYVGLLRKGAGKVALLTLLFTAIGMGARYLLEYGEVSNTTNFTLLNIALYLVLAPVLVTATFVVAPKLDHGD